MPGQHITLGLIRQFVKVLVVRGSCFKYLWNKSSSKTERNAKKSSFVGWRNYGIKEIMYKNYIAVAVKVTGTTVKMAFRCTQDMKMLNTLCMRRCKQYAKIT